MLPVAAALVRVIWSSMAASLVVVLAFSLAVLGHVRAGEMRASGKTASAFWYSALALCGITGFAAAVVYGLILLTQKS